MKETILVFISSMVGILIMVFGAVFFSHLIYAFDHWLTKIFGG